jgi:hypothetical protein
MDRDDADYYMRRSRQEATAAVAADKPEIARLHLEIAASYAVKALVGDASRAAGDEGESGDGADNFRRLPRSGQA